MDGSHILIVFSMLFIGAEYCLFQYPLEHGHHSFLVSFLGHLCWIALCAFAVFVLHLEA